MMTIRDYSEDDDFYTQGFERDGVVSIWIGLNPGDVDGDVDVLQGLCGVGYYRADDQEGNSFDFELTDLSDLMRDLSYSESYIISAIDAARIKGHERARWVIVQYDFDYRPEGVKRPIANDPIFIGSFPYVAD
jgi:hypothetical protein